MLTQWETLKHNIEVFKSDLAKSNGLNPPPSDWKEQVVKIIGKHPSILSKTTKQEYQALSLQQQELARKVACKFWAYMCSKDKSFSGCLPLQIEMNAERIFHWTEGLSLGYTEMIPVQSIYANKYLIMHYVESYGFIPHVECDQLYLTGIRTGFWTQEYGGMQNTNV